MITANLTFHPVLKTLGADPRFEHYDIEYLSGNMFNFLGNGTHIADVTGVSDPKYLKCAVSSEFLY